MYTSGPRWSADAGQADWIAGRLAPWASGTVTTVVPGGFEAYARVLHPAETPDNRDRLVRAGGSHGGSVHPGLRGSGELRAELIRYLTRAVLALAEM